jgi:hypothetical protein
MDRIQNPSNSECYTLSSEPLRIYLIYSSFLCFFSNKYQSASPSATSATLLLPFLAWHHRPMRLKASHLPSTNNLVAVNSVVQYRDLYQSWNSSVFCIFLCTEANACLNFVICKLIYQTELLLMRYYINSLFKMLEMKINVIIVENTVW